MIKKCSSLLLLAALGFILIVIYFIKINTPNDTSAAWLFYPILIVILVYYFTFAIKLFKDNKNDLLSLLFLIIPFLVGAISIYLLAYVFKVNLKVASTVDELLIYTFMILTYISPILCYILSLVINQKKKL